MLGYYHSVSMGRTAARQHLQNVFALQAPILCAVVTYGG
jgi:hypothetical protein